MCLYPTSLTSSIGLLRLGQNVQMVVKLCYYVASYRNPNCLPTAQHTQSYHFPRWKVVPMRLYCLQPGLPQSSTCYKLVQLTGNFWSVSPHLITRGYRSLSLVLDWSTKLVLSEVCVSSTLARAYIAG